MENDIGIELLSFVISVCDRLFVCICGYFNTLLSGVLIKCFNKLLLKISS